MYICFHAHTHTHHTHTHDSFINTQTLKHTHSQTHTNAQTHTIHIHINIRTYMYMYPDAETKEVWAQFEFFRGLQHRGRPSLAQRQVMRGGATVLSKMALPRSREMQSYICHVHSALLLHMWGSFVTYIGLFCQVLSSCEMHSYILLYQHNNNALIYKAVRAQ